MQRFVFATTIISAFLAGCQPAIPAASPSPILPLKTVRLYETGVGYFERTGPVSPSAGTSLPVPAGHLDDALKTLVVLSQGGESSVDGLEFESSVTEGMARALAGLPTKVDTPISYLELLSSLKGEEVEVKTASGVHAGRVIDVIKPPPEEASRANEDDEDDAKKSNAGAAKAPRPELVLLLLTNDKEIRRFPSDSFHAVRPISKVASKRLGLALNALSTRSAQSRRMLRVVAHAAGPVTLGYIAEAPIWRTTYRLVLGDKENDGVLQGWALLHNDTDEDWKSVRVELVNGRPDSFLFPLSAPRYARRGLAAPEDELSTIPQLLDKTPDSIWGDYADLEEGGSTGYGYGGGYGRVGSSHRARPPSIRMGATSVSGGVGASPMLEIGNLAAIQQAEGVESEALFTYTLPRPVDLRAHGSSLVPFVQSHVETTRITWIDGAGDKVRTGVKFVNSTRQTLPPGPIAFFADGGFVGESGLDRLKPGERRFMHFGLDLDVEASIESISSSNEPKKLTFEHDYLHEHFVKHDISKYLIENRSAHPRKVHWVLNVVTNAKVQGPDEVTFDPESSKAVAVFNVGARQKIEKRVVSDQGLSRTTRLDTIDLSMLKRFSEITTLPEEQRKIALEAAEKRKEMDATSTATAQTKQSIEEVEKDIERLRQHLAALGGDKGTTAAGNPFVQRILNAEDRLAKLREKLDALNKESETRQDALRLVLKKLGTGEKG